MASSSAVTITAHPRSATVGLAAASGSTLTTLADGTGPRTQRASGHAPEEPDPTALRTARRGPAAPTGATAGHARRARARTGTRARTRDARRRTRRTRGEGRLDCAGKRALVGHARTRASRSRRTERRRQLGVATNLSLSHDEDPLEAGTELRLTLPLSVSRQQQGLSGRRWAASRS
jgi:hypothetical protein